MKIHFVGVGGVAMGNFAAMLRASGHHVTGSDKELYPPMSDKLKEWKIQVLPFDRANVRKVDLCVIGNVISRGNVEVEEILNQNISYTSMSQGLYDFYLKGRDVVVVAGTHGKTTTTMLIDHILTEAGLGNGLFVGGVRADGHDGFRIPTSNLFVIEGDEYDTAFFDKAPKFLHYRPKYLALNYIEYDHADIYKNYEEYRWAFERLLRLLPGNGLIAACEESFGVKEVLADYKWSQVSLYGLKDFIRKGTTVNFKDYGEIENFPLIGDYNCLNALAAIRITTQLGLSFDQIRSSIRSFAGVKRRMERRMHAKTRLGEILFLEDFAHHPTAVKLALQGVREAYPNHCIHALFEPRSASAHRKSFEEDYKPAFKDADYVYITDVFNKEKVPTDQRMDIKVLTDHIRDRRENKGIFFEPDSSGLVEKLSGILKQGDSGDSVDANPNQNQNQNPSPNHVILVMSNGAFGGIYEKIEQIIGEVMV